MDRVSQKLLVSPVPWPRSNGAFDVHLMLTDMWGRKLGGAFVNHLSLGNITIESMDFTIHFKTRAVSHIGAWYLFCVV